MNKTKTTNNSIPGKNKTGQSCHIRSHPVSHETSPHLAGLFSALSDGRSGQAEVDAEAVEEDEATQRIEGRVGVREA
jgi:hypothetical protein